MPYVYISKMEFYQLGIERHVIVEILSVVGMEYCTNDTNVLFSLTTFHICECVYACIYICTYACLSQLCTHIHTHTCTTHNSYMHAHALAHTHAYTHPDT